MSKPIPPPSTVPPVKSLAGPPVRPRFEIIALTGYMGVHHGRTNRRPTTTWTVVDKLNEGRAVGLDHYKLEYAEQERNEYEAAWEFWLATSEWIQPRTEVRRRELRYQKGGSRFRPWCGACKAKAPAGSTKCPTCSRSLF